MSPSFSGASVSFRSFAHPLQLPTPVLRELAVPGGRHKVKKYLAYFPPKFKDGFDAAFSRGTRQIS